MPGCAMLSHVLHSVCHPDLSATAKAWWCYVLPCRLHMASWRLKSGCTSNSKPGIVIISCITWIFTMVHCRSVSNCGGGLTLLLEVHSLVEHCNFSQTSCRSVLLWCEPLILPLPVLPVPVCLQALGEVKSFSVLEIFTDRHLKHLKNHLQTQAVHSPTCLLYLSFQDTDTLGKFGL